MAMRQTDSEPPVEESSAEDTAEYSAKSDAESGAEAAPASGYAAAVRTEQAYVTMLYHLLDQARERSELELASVRAQGGAGGTHQARLERDVSSAEHEKRITQLSLTERGLCFGRVDDEQRLTLYIGRIGLRDDDYDLKLIDWRAPAASGPVRAQVRPPGSKSVTNRALILAALADGPTMITNPLRARDTLLMAAALRGLGAVIDEDGAPAAWRVTPGSVSGAAIVDVGNAGTVLLWEAACPRSGVWRPARPAAQPWWTSATPGP